MAKKKPGTFDIFNGLWSRGDIDDTPLDHFSDSRNNTFIGGVNSRDSTSQYNALTNTIRMALYKPNPPFTGTNVPRIIALKSNGDLVDVLLGVTLYSNVNMKDFGFVNFFGRCFISPSDGKVGLNGIKVKVYDGTGLAGFRDAAGGRPPVAMTAALHAPLGGGIIDLGTHLISYSFETASGFVTKPAPFVAIDCFGGTNIDITYLPLGPAGTAARWILFTKAIPFRANLTIPFDVSDASVQRYPLFFALRIGDNTTTYSVGSPYSFGVYDENLVDSADYLYTIMESIPAGVGLMDYKGRMISYGEYSNPSIVRGSTIGEPESFSETSGFFITDPADSTGIRCATEFRGSLFCFKQQRGYVTEDNQLEPSTWNVTNFEKAVGTQQYGIAAILDAKGSSVEGFVIAETGALHYFTGTVVEPELSFKIRDLWLRINKSYFHLVQVVNDPINRRLYILIPLDAAVAVSHIIFGDYRDGLNAKNIKWDLWEFATAPTSMLAYTDFTGDVPSLVTRISNLSKILTLNVNTPGSDDGAAIDSYFQLAPLRAFSGISEYTRIRVRGSGAGTINLTAYGEDKVISTTPASITLPATPGREYTVPMNLVSEQCILKVRCAALNQKYKIKFITIDNASYADERPR